MKGKTVLSVMEFAGDVNATFYDDGTVWIAATRRLTADELRLIAKEAAECEMLYERHGYNPDLPKRLP